MTDEDSDPQIFMENGKEGSYFERESEQLAEMKAKDFVVKDGEAFTFRSGAVYKAKALLTLIISSMEGLGSARGSGKMACDMAWGSKSGAMARALRASQRAYFIIYSSLIWRGGRRTRRRAWANSYTAGA